MNREIKFRVWDKKSKELVYFGLHLTNGNCVIENDCLYVMFDGVYVSITDDDVVLMQSTGLHDKNGLEVYEGDIVKFHTGLREYKGLVTWDNEMALYMLTHVGRKLEIWDISSVVRLGCPIEVIGNIHDNPDLLKVGGDIS